MEFFSEYDCAYLAGFIDGEGNIAVSRHKTKGVLNDYTNYILKLSICNTDLRVINWVIKKFGGTLQKDNPRSPTISKKILFRIWWQNEDARETLIKVSKYLVIKKDRANFLIKEYPKKYLREKNKREFCYQEVKRLTNNSEFTSPILKPVNMAESESKK